MPGVEVDNGLSLKALYVILIEPAVYSMQKNAEGREQSGKGIEESPTLEGESQQENPGRRRWNFLLVHI